MKVLTSDRNAGYCIANNRGIVASKGEYIVLLNNDTYVSPTWLEELVRVLDINPCVAGCGSKIMDANTSSVRALVGELLDKYGWVGSLVDNSILSGTIIDTFFYPSFVAVIMRRSIFERAGIFDENLFITGDYDLGWRIRLLGYSFAASMSSVCYHYGSYTVKMFPNLKRFYLMYREKIYILLKNFSFSSLLRRFPVSIALMLLASVYKSLRSKQPYLPMLIRASLWNLRNVRKLWIERIKIQSSRTVTDDGIASYMCQCSLILNSRARLNI